MHSPISTRRHVSCTPAFTDCHLWKLIARNWGPTETMRTQTSAVCCKVPMPDVLCRDLRHANKPPSRAERQSYARRFTIHSLTSTGSTDEIQRTFRTSAKLFRICSQSVSVHGTFAHGPERLFPCKYGAENDCGLRASAAGARRSFWLRLL